MPPGESGASWLQPGAFCAKAGSAAREAPRASAATPIVILRRILFVPFFFSSELAVADYQLRRRNFLIWFSIGKITWLVISGRVANINATKKIGQIW
jgi:hypothetical protein